MASPDTLVRAMIQSPRLIRGTALRLPVVDPVVGILTALILVGLVLRLIGLNSQLWYDEIYSLVVTSRPPLGVILTTYFGDIQHPLNSVLVGCSISVLGEAPWTVRLPAVLFGIASIPLMFLVGRAVSTIREGILAASLLTFSYHHIWFSQNSRGYSALLFWTLLCTLLLYQGLKDHSWPPFLAYSVAATLGAYTHPTFVFVVIGHAAAILPIATKAYRAGHNVRVWLVMPSVAISLSGILSLVLYAPIVNQVIRYYQQSSGKMKAISTPGWALLETIRGLELGLGSQLVLGVAVLLVGCGLWGFWRENRQAFYLLAFPTAAAGLGILAMRGSMYPRYLFLLFGFGILFVVHGATVLGAWLGKFGNPQRAAMLGRLIGVGCIILVIAASTATLGRVYRLPKQDFSAALQFVESQRQSAEPVMTAGAAAWPYQNYYGRDWPKIKSLQQIESLGGKHGRVWLLYTFPRYIEDETPGLMDAIHQQFKTIRVFPGTLSHGEVFVCVKDDVEPATLGRTSLSRSGQ